MQLKQHKQLISDKTTTSQQGFKVKTNVKAGPYFFSVSKPEFLEVDTCNQTVEDLPGWLKPPV
ncbi:hypothetical protein QUF64_10935 [Anaerolineales bacterium HSG6]|nr:hypothetical protein [Anaerolineales bacterium HSG6]MDM8530356.1 hypothetical protein [Anaerolineales bacterium HSG25]